VCKLSQVCRIWCRLNSKRSSVPDTELAHIAERGKRLDESKQGAGLGLSIVEDIADIYRLQVTYGRAELGGLRVEIRV
jgi:signal transduction histidine kinase